MCTGLVYQRGWSSIGCLCNVLCTVYCVLCAVYYTVCSMVSRCISWASNWISAVACWASAPNHSPSSIVNTPLYFPTTTPPLPPSLLPYISATHTVVQLHSSATMENQISGRTSEPSKLSTTHGSTSTCFQFPPPWPRLHPVYLDFSLFHLECNCLTSHHM